MKRAIIIHCWGGSPEYCWYPDTQRTLKAEGFQVQVLAMPDTDYPQLSAWLPVLQQAVGVPDTDLFLIGHSLGCITIMKYLEMLPADVQIGGAVFVAGFPESLGYKETASFFEEPVNLAAVKSHLPRVVAIHSDDDPYVPLRHGDTLRDQLGAELIVKHGMKHFSGAVDGEESCTSLPEVAQSILHMNAL